jgi:hypothetical protein
MRLRGIDLNSIQGTLLNAYSEAERIRKELKLSNLSVKDVGFFALIEKYLDDKGFKIYYTDKLHNFEHNGKKWGHIPSVTFYADQYQKENGGHIYIYDKYSNKKRKELLIHELIHIMDKLTPTWSTDKFDGNNMFMLSKPIMNRVELSTELIALALMMPSDSLQNDLFDCSYDINKIVQNYKAIETNTVLLWIIMHDYFFAHYATIFILKDNEGNDFPLTIDEHSNAESKFDVGNIAINADSIAYKSKRAKQSQSGESTIDNKKYQCFCFYEKEVHQPLPSDIYPVEMIVTCDKMVIIGWSKHIYDFIQRLDFKQNKNSAENP